MDNGISFIVRIRDEDDILEKSIRSLFTITVPHEILLILHICKDNSKQIAEKLASENPNIKVLEYDKPISRPGYETLCTDKDSPHSIMTYYTWCYNQAIYPWRFKWDADFIATSDLITYINSSGWCRDTTKSHELFLHAACPDGVKNTERYLTSGNFTFQKFWFWEFINMTSPVLQLWINLDIIHQSELSCKKKYWNYPPWFLDHMYLQSHPEHYEEAFTVLTKYIKLIEICGPEPVGQARASNPESAVIFPRVKDNIEILKQYGIDCAL
jgi:hypothetical protein